MKLPNAERAIVDIAKLRDYCLNPEHPRDRHKARVSAAVLGLASSDAEALRSAILQAIHINDASATERDAYGQRYVVDFLMSNSVGTAMIRSSWIIRMNEDVPRLTSCYVL